MRRHFSIPAAFFLLGLTSCPDSSPSAEPDAEPDVAQEGAAADTVAKPEAPPPEPQVEEDAFVTVISVVRKIKSDERKIDDPAGKSKKKVSNWVATLYRGEQATILASEDDWAQVRASDESEGWMKKKNLIRAADVKLATVTEEVKTFRRPDLLALNSAKKLEPGELLYVAKEKEQFSQVNYYGTAKAWVLTEKLTTDVTEVAAAKLINKIRYLQKKNDPSAAEFVEMAKSQFASSKLISLLEEQEEEKKAEDEAKAAEEAEKAKEGGTPADQAAEKKEEG